MQCKYCKGKIKQSNVTLNHRFMNERMIVDVLHNCGQHLGTGRIKINKDEE